MHIENSLKKLKEVDIRINKINDIRVPILRIAVDIAVISGDRRKIRSDVLTKMNNKKHYMKINDIKILV